MSEDGTVEICESTQMEHKCPDVTVVDQAAEEKTFVNFLVPWDRNMVTKKEEKITN